MYLRVGSFEINKTEEKGVGDFCGNELIEKEDFKAVWMRSFSSSIELLN